MAQQGGTYRFEGRGSLLWPSRQNGSKKDGEKPAIEQRGTNARDSPKALNPEDGQNDDQEWALVPQPSEHDEEEPPRRGFSSHFDMTFGWGKWKFTVLSWDINVSKADKSSQHSPQ